MHRRHLTVREYAAAYGVSAATVYSMCAAGKLPHVRLGAGRGTIRIPEDAAVQVCGSGEGRPGTPAAPTKAAKQKSVAKPKAVRLNHLRQPS